MGWDGFAAKALRPKDFCFSSFYWDEKVTKLRFGLVFVSRKIAKELSFPEFSSLYPNVFLKTTAIAPIVPKPREEILLCRGSAQKIGVNSGK
jgi:hypothetical protein